MAKATIIVAANLVCDPVIGMVLLCRLGPAWFAQSSVKNPTPQIAVGRLLGMNLHIQPAIPKILDLSRRQFERSAHRTAGSLGHAQIEDHRATKALRTLVYLREGSG